MPHSGTCAPGQPKPEPGALSAMARKLLRRPWTPQDTALLVQLLREGKDYGQIARKMNRSVETVRIYARRLAESERRLGERG